MKMKCFAGLTHGAFMRRHWQKKPLLARDALPQYADAVTREDLLALAESDHVESRIVLKRGPRWRVQHGPFTRRYLASLPRSGWTLLVQGVDQTSQHAARLLREFAFIPYARLDDMMVSYAAPGGGVGPHYDSYDVFLVQGAGRRRWRVSRQRDLALVADAPLSILRRFTPTREWTLERGDVLYLPPRCAHEGVAVGDCITYSIGFRAAGAQELGLRFLEYLEDRLDLDGMYADPDLKATRAPARIPAALISRSVAVLDQLRWSRDDVVQFLGRDLSEPKANVVFAPPARPLAPEAFARSAARSGVRLALPTRMLACGKHVFINGESHRCREVSLRTLLRLANERELLPPVSLDADTRKLVFGWYRAGYVEVGIGRQAEAA